VPGTVTAGNGVRVPALTVPQPNMRNAASVAGLSNLIALSFSTDARIRLTTTS